MKFKNSVHAALLTTALIAGTAAPAFAADGGPTFSAADKAMAAVQNATGTTGLAPDSTTGTVLATAAGSSPSPPRPAPKDG
ncbi:hypothetical protein [Streptomyces xanthophaeus]|uniref:hypothetical protein n=1 Tax=Streptomyces xanthophaeus TaxID=67385 RepID=UPI0026496679|nr:hypothetical protein [Streptomyces xanthophaeus]WKD31145.1 hypothetical protein KO717_03635 [Streptomyces xanthophaeus]